MHFLKNKFFTYLSDETFIKLKYFAHFYRVIDLKNPKTFNEKINWLKLYDRDERYTMMVDKHKVKRYVSDLIGEQFIIPTIGIYDSFDEIDFNKLPNQFVIKCTHDCGGIVICTDKNNFDVLNAKKKINKCLNRNYFYNNREWPYKNVKPRIIIEKYMKDGDSPNLNDYKVFCFNGEPKYILVCSNRNGFYKNTDFYDFNWNLQPFSRQNHINNPNGISRPVRLQEIYDISKKLSQKIPFVRVDLYEINSQIYFGELTFFPSAGFEGFNPKEWDTKLGDLIQLDLKK